MTKTLELNGETRTAIFSECEKYRYSLEIVWRDILDTELKLMQVIGLNPSTATELVDDPTIRRCKAFARREGCNGLVMTNLFAWRDTKPENMKKADSPIGEKVWCDDTAGWHEENDCKLYVASKRSALHVAAWGNHGVFKERGRAVAKLIPNLKCFRITGKGEPEHSLYMPADQPLFPYVPSVL